MHNILQIYIRMYFYIKIIHIFIYILYIVYTILLIVFHQYQIIFYMLLKVYTKTIYCCQNN